MFIVPIIGIVRSGATFCCNRYCCDFLLCSFSSIHSSRDYKRTWKYDRIVTIDSLWKKMFVQWRVQSYWLVKNHHVYIQSNYISDLAVSENISHPTYNLKHWIVEPTNESDATNNVKVHLLFKSSGKLYFIIRMLQTIIPDQKTNPTRNQRYWSP